MERIKTRSDLIIILFISSVIIFWNLGKGSLTSWDEGVYAQVAREIFTSNNLIDLTWLGSRWSDKPPLYMWMTAFFYKIFGINEFSARLFSALCGIGTIIVTYLFASRLYSRQVAIASALILVSTWHFIWSSKIGMLDSAFTFFMCVSFFLFKLGEDKKIYLFLALLSFTCAFLTKGFTAIFIPCALFFYLIFTGKIKMLLEPALIWGIAVSLIILGWWHWTAFSHYGKAFIDGYFIKHIFIRTTQAVEGHSGGFFNYFKVLPNKGRPWGWVAIFVLPVAVARIFLRNEKENILPVTWFVTVFLIASLVKTKLHWYIIPIYPASSMLSGWAISRVLKKATVGAVAVLAFVFLVYLSVGKQIFNLDYSPESKNIAQVAAGILRGSEKIYIYNSADPSLRFYCAKISENISDAAKLNTLFGQKNKYIVFERIFFETLKEQRLSIIAQNRYFVITKTNKND